MSTSGTTPSYPGQRPSGNANDVRVYQTPEKQAQQTARTGVTTKKSTTTAMWWILAAIAIAIILYFVLRS